MGYIADQPIGKRPDSGTDERMRLRILRIKNRFDQGISLEAFQVNDLESLLRILRNEKAGEKEIELIEQRISEYERRQSQKKHVPYSLA